MLTERQHLVEFSPVIKSFIPMYEKWGLLHILHHKSFSKCCDFKTFHLEIGHSNTILMKNSYPPCFTDSFIKSYLNKLHTPKIIVHNVSKTDVFVDLSFLGSTSFLFERRLKNLII